MDNFDRLIELIDDLQPDMFKLFVYIGLFLPVWFLDAIGVPVKGVE